MLKYFMNLKYFYLVSTVSDETNSSLYLMVLIWEENICGQNEAAGRYQKLDQHNKILWT